MLASLNHPNIVTIHSFEEVGGVHVLTMELVDGRPLHQHIPKGGLPVERILDFAAAISEALAAAHEKGIVHRDLKPANVMVTTEGRVKVLDFGLAKEVLEANSSAETLAPDEYTRIGVIVGTPAYMSPEQVEGRLVDHRSDIFSLGTLLYEMATGEKPFQGQSAAELASAILRDTPRPVREMRAELPEGLEGVIQRCLKKSAADRFPVARDLRTGLRSVTTGIEADSGAARAREGFWVAVLPFEYSGSNAEIAALAEGLTEDIVTGLSRFSYLCVIARSSTLRYARTTVDVRAVGKELGARYVMEGSLRQAGAHDCASQCSWSTPPPACHLWAETFDRIVSRGRNFLALQDEIVPRIVATVADTYGVLPHTMSEALRDRDPEKLTPHEASAAQLRAFPAHLRRRARRSKGRPGTGRRASAGIRGWLGHALDDDQGGVHAWA